MNLEDNGANGRGDDEEDEDEEPEEDTEDESEEHVSEKIAERDEVLQFRVGRSEWHATLERARGRARGSSRPPGGVEEFAVTSFQKRFQKLISRIDFELLIPFFDPMLLRFIAGPLSWSSRPRRSLNLHLHPRPRLQV